MAKYAIVSEGSIVDVDKDSRVVDLSTLDPDIWAVDWNTSSSKGNVEYRPESGRGSNPIDDFSPYQQYVDAWTTAPAPPAPPPVGPGDARIRPIPASVNSIPVLRDAVNEILAYLRGA